MSCEWRRQCASLAGQLHWQSTLWKPEAPQAKSSGLTASMRATWCTHPHPPCAVLCAPWIPRRYIHTYQVTWVKDKEPTLTPADLQRSSEWLLPLARCL